MTAGAALVLQGGVLFTPADRPDRFDKGWSASNGQLILDLEDAVAPERKPLARGQVQAWLGATARMPLVRLNAVDSPYFRDDRAKLGGIDLPYLIVPKVDAPGDLEAVRAVWPRAHLFPLIESPQGLEAAVEIARSPGVVQLALGGLDLHAECRVPFPHSGLLEHCRIRLMLASRLAGLPGPIDTPYPGFRDAHEVETDAKAAAKLGFAAKLCIHPAQLDTVNGAFAPSQDEVEWAREVLAAAHAGGGAGAVQVRGRMVDAPVIAAAQRLLSRLPGGAPASGGINPA